MESNIDINPTEKKQEICSLLQKLSCKYEIHTSGCDKEYEYLGENDVCITVTNPNSDYPLYIDLEDGGEFTLSYYNWHTHYYCEECDYQELCEDLRGIIDNSKCILIINSNKRWLSSRVLNARADNEFNYKKDIAKLPKEFQTEIKKLGGNIVLYYWNVKCNVTIKI